MMKIVLFVIALTLISGCSTRWVQAGKTAHDAERDRFDCENVIVTKHGGWRNVEPVTAALEINECMRLKGYHAERD